MYLRKERIPQAGLSNLDYRLFEFTILYKSYRMLLEQKIKIKLISKSLRIIQLMP